MKDEKRGGEKGFFGENGHDINKMSNEKNRKKPKKVGKKRQK
ncbi:hypothetical protein [Crocosphaera chwakensis]|uniref:Uncharacterized protein n=1 Tax=Crocosphaera chwakensis CCY0110 TaxID=391612 RepID=A3IXC6_9CHRO|nr:hypothetical protein [Crocosphaera chwakensis]EAZ88869.1 hypothetical protein CY0110_31285 [Crocosphaera chwakensis CCY0110]